MGSGASLLVRHYQEDLGGCLSYSVNFISKLQESGLTEDDAHKLRFSDLTADETKTLHSSFKSLASLRIPYFDAEGTPIKDRPAFKDCEDFYRLRYLASRPGFFRQVDKKSKYHQQPGTLCAAYYPQNLEKGSWKDIIQDAGTPIIFTEGELKAAKACKEGFPTIGIAGVWNWCSRKHGHDLLPSLACINFVRRDVYICYDSDYKTNPQVLAGLKELSETLERYGAYCHLMTLPSDIGDEKVGLDDFLVEHGAEQGRKMLTTLIEEAVTISTTAPLFQLNERYCYVSHPPAIVDNKVKRLLKKDHFKDATQNMYYMAPQLNKEGEIKYKPAHIGERWLAWPLRNQADIIVYEPGKEGTVLVNDNSQTEVVGYNTWSGWACDPTEGGVSCFLELVNYMFATAEEEHRHWFLQWLAYPLQHPGHKLLTAVVLQGVLQGTGKTTMGYTMREIYGKHFQEIKQWDIDSQFNEWSVDKSFILADELTGSKQRLFSDTLKSFITQREVSVNRKNIPAYNIADHMNYLFTSNHPDAFYLEDTDRRFFIMTLPDSSLPESFFAEYDRRYFKGGEASHIFHYLLNYDLTGFNPSGHAPKTKAKERMHELGLSDLDHFIRDLPNNPGVLLASCCDMLTAKDVKELYKASEDVADNSKRSITVNGVARALSASNATKVNQGNPVHFQRKCVRYYAFKNKDKWSNASQKDVVTYLESFGTGGKKKEKFE